MSNNPDCRALLISWTLAAVGVYLISVFERGGVLLAIIPIAIAQNMRLAHDQIMFERIRHSSWWMRFSGVYYFVLLMVSIVSVRKDIQLIDMPFIYFVLMILFPFLLAMIVNDLAQCSRANR